MTTVKKRVQLARSLRRSNVAAEALLWKALRNRALSGLKFRRQHPIGPYIADFAWVEGKVVVELDGDSHAWSEREDAERTALLETEGWLVLRFWNADVYESLETVKDTIYETCAERMQS